MKYQYLCICCGPYFFEYYLCVRCRNRHAKHDQWQIQDLQTGVGNAILDRFANPGISGLSLLNPGIPGLIPGLNRARLWLAIAGLVIGKIATTTTTMHIVIGR